MAPLALAGLLALAAPPDVPVTGRAVPPLTAFDALVLEVLRDTKVPGAALAVTKGGRLVYARGFGFADRDARTPVDPDALFRVASVSKPFTAAAVLKLADRGKLDLDAPVWPLLKLAPILAPGETPDPRWKAVTVRHLLGHEGGFDRDKSGDPMFLPFKIAAAARADPPPVPRGVVQYVMGRPLDFDPGTRSAYSNVGYCVLGRVIEAVTGEGYEAHVRKAILRPLGITRMRVGHTWPGGALPGEVTYYDTVNPPAASVFDPRRKEKVPTPYGAWCLETMDAHGGWVASPVELVRFLAALEAPDRFPAVRGKRLQEWFGPGYGFEGYLDGTSAAIQWTKSGDVTYAVAFNGTAGIGKGITTPAARVTARMGKLIRGVASWPAGDLFDEYLK